MLKKTIFCVCEGGGGGGPDPLFSPLDLCMFSEFNPILTKQGLLCFCLFALILKVPVNSYGQVGLFSSPNHILGKLDLVVNQYFLHIPLLVTDNNPS